MTWSIVFRERDSGRIAIAVATKFFAVGADDIGYYGLPEQGLRDNGGELPFWIGCRAGCQVIGIESSGNVKGCLSLPSSMHGEKRFVEGNLRERSLSEIWNPSRLAS